MRYRDRRGAHKVLVGKTERKRSLRRPTHIWRNKIKAHLQEMDGVKDWIDLAQDRDRWCALVNAVMKLRVP
jgi:hypothetical protein